MASLAGVLKDRYETAFREVGISTAQFTLLSAIGYAGESPITSLTRYVARDQTTLSRGVERLRKRGWVAVIQPDDDRRRHLVRLTPEGREVLSAAMDAWERVRDELEDTLGAETVDRLIDLSWHAVKTLRGETD